MVFVSKLKQILACLFLSSACSGSKESGEEPYLKLFHREKQQFLKAVEINKSILVDGICSNLTLLR